MFRSTAARSVSRSLSSFNAPLQRTSLRGIIPKAGITTSTRPTASSRVLSVALRQPVQKALVRHATSVTHDEKAYQELMQEKLVATPETVSVQSSVHPLNSEVGVANPEQDVDMMAGIRGDFRTIVDTFTLSEVPREALYVGLAGVVPYLATSLATVYLSFDIQYAAVHDQGFILSGATAETLLHIIEPIQLGYGASIISFLGAIHWGLEWAGYGGHQGYPRYSIGIVATAVAWPTLLLSAEVGLIAQFLAFTFLYYADARASVRGWAPPWYSTYRFVLTFVVGASIVMSLIGRGQIADLITRPTGAADRMRQLRQRRVEELEAQAAEGKEEDDEEEEEEAEDGDEE